MVGGREKDESTYLQGEQSCSTRDQCLFESWWGSPIIVLVKFAVRLEECNLGMPQKVKNIQ